MTAAAAWTGAWTCAWSQHTARVVSVGCRLDAIYHCGGVGDPLTPSGRGHKHIVGKNEGPTVHIRFDT